MALQLVRTSQTAEFVHATDSDAILPVDGAAWPGPLEGWLSAVGQPASCTRVRVRPLSATELDSAQALLAPEGASVDAKSRGAAQWAERLCQLGVVALIDNGTEGPCDGIASQYVYAIALLVQAVTLHGPFGRRPPRSAGAQ